MRDRLASLTVLSHQTVGCVGDGFYKAPEEVEGGQEALCAKLVAELEKNESKLTLQNHSSSSRQQPDHCWHYGYYKSVQLFSSVVGITHIT